MKKSLPLFISIIGNYYQSFQKKTGPVAWVSAFFPLEILEGFRLEYVFPESYAAVISASGKAGQFIDVAVQNGFDRDLCSYSTCFQGSWFSREGPRGTLPTPDLLLSTTNQCNTLPGWWSVHASKLQVPHFIFDYPSPRIESNSHSSYILHQHQELIGFLEGILKRPFDEEKARIALEHSQKSIQAWKAIGDLRKNVYISSQITFDYLLPLIIRRCHPDTSLFYSHLKDELSLTASPLTLEKRLLWLGYPLWFEGKRYLSSIEDARLKVIMDDYSTWWNLRFVGNDFVEKLHHAYRFTHLNVAFEASVQELEKMVREYRIDGIIFNCNKSCRRSNALLRALARTSSLPSLIIDSDMVDPTYAVEKPMALRIMAFKELFEHVSGN